MFTATAISAPTTITSATPAAVTALMSTTAGATSAAMSAAAAAALGELRRYQYERRMSTIKFGSQFCLFWPFLRLSGRSFFFYF